MYCNFDFCGTMYCCILYCVDAFKFYLIESKTLDFAHLLGLIDYHIMVTGVLTYWLAYATLWKKLPA